MNMDTKISCRFAHRVHGKIPAFLTETRNSTCNFDCGSPDDQSSHLMEVDTNIQKVDDLKFDPNTRIYHSAAIMPVFKPLELCEVDIITTDCAPPIPSIRQFHAHTSTSEYVSLLEIQNCSLFDRMETFVTIEDLHGHSSQFRQELEQSSPTKLTKRHKTVISNNEQQEYASDFNTTELGYCYLDNGTTTAMYACLSSTVQAGGLFKLSGLDTTMCDSMTVYANVKNSYYLQHLPPIFRQTSYSHQNSDNYSTAQSKTFDPGIGVVVP